MKAPHLRRSSSLFLFAASLLLSLIATGAARAQFELVLQLDKVNYIDQEFITATVTVTNRSGADVILGAARGSKSWLSFDISDSQGRELPSMALPTDDVTPIFRAGESMTRKVKMIDVYPEGELGTYAMKAVAYHPPSGSYYDSNRARFVVTDVKPYKDVLTFGVPEGYSGAGRTRAYELLVQRDGDHTYLYVRLRDTVSKSQVITYPLAPITLARDPQYTLDNLNVMHVLFMAGPKIHIHAIIEPDGKLRSKTIYKEQENSRPTLFRTEAGGIVARGGELIDPSASKVAAKKSRTLSERPPGL